MYSLYAVARSHIQIMNTAIRAAEFTGWDAVSNVTLRDLFSDAEKSGAHCYWGFWTSEDLDRPLPAFSPLYN